MKKYADFVFVSAPHKPNLPEEEQVPDADPRGWWFSRSENHFKATDETDLDAGFEESVHFLKETVQTEGPFDGIFGFSQGACMGALLCVLQLQEQFPSQFRFAIFAAGFLSKSAQHSFQRQVRLTVPTLHICGKTDNIITIDMSSELIDLCDNPITVTHSGGHFVPTLTEEKQKILAFLNRALS